MSSPPKEDHAQRVCSTCKQRKKGCDKKLPICGYCAKRGLSCNYYDNDSGILFGPAPSKDGVVGISLPAWQRQRLSQAEGTSNFITPLLQLGPFNTPLLPISGLSTIDETVYQHVRSIYQSLRLTFHEASTRFFQNFQNWLPIITPERLYQAIVAAECRIPSADLSILLLSICLVTTRLHDEAPIQATGPASLYVLIKTLYAQVQAMTQASTLLTQAGLVVSAYEYASGQLDSAYVSIGACARMGHTIGIDNAGDRLAESHADAESRLDVMEQWNLWWGIIILERFILLEMSPSRYKHITAACPTCNISLPSDIICEGELGLSYDEMQMCLPTSGHSHNSFGRQAQTVYILDQTLRIINSPTTPERRLWELAKLDSKLQDDLMQLMEERSYANGLRCGAAATVIRSLYLLHQDIIAHATTLAPIATREQWKRRSEAALDTASKIMMDVAEHHLNHISHHGVDSLHFCCGCNLRVAIRYIQSRCNDGCGEDVFFVNGLEKLTLLERAFRERWGSPRSEISQYGV
ncbi:hypothetical protein F5Y13DRAFT_196297 [Hypoxylon sp. FL1857]|nr:hypothetical protein F5Y13DRAFT_196297 [Hypoxylon sp. FL1857]